MSCATKGLLTPFLGNGGAQVGVGAPVRWSLSWG